MDDSPKRFHSRPEDHKPLSIEALSLHARISPAFIRLCIQTGCPAPKSCLSQSKLIGWLTFHYDNVRAACGLRPLASIEGVRGKARRALQLANTMLTLLEFAESRSTNCAEKARLRAVQELVERTV